MSLTHEEAKPFYIAGLPTQTSKGESTPFEEIKLHTGRFGLTAAHSASVWHGNQHHDTKSAMHLPAPPPQTSPVFLLVQSSEQNGANTLPASPPTQKSDMQSAPVSQGFPSGVSPCVSHPAKIILAHNNHALFSSHRFIMTKPPRMTFRV